MNHKTNKILGIITATLGGLLLILVAALLIRGSRIGDIFNFSELVNRQTSSSSPQESDPSSTDPGASSESTEQITTTGTEPPELKYSTKLRVGVSRLEGKFDPFQNLCEGDESVMKLVGINLLTRDRAGKVIMQASEGEYSYYQGKRYLYTGPADIMVEYNEEADETSFTLRLKDGIFFSDGVKLTVDDLIFNLYVRLQPNFQGDGFLRGYDVVGLKNYYYNNSLAESIEISSEEIWEEVFNPGETMEAYIRQTIANVLHAEAEQSENIWTSYAALGYGNSAVEFFYNLYGRDLNYNLLDKSLEQVCEDVIASYGLDFRALAERYAVDENFFDASMADYCREMLLNRRMQESGGEPVDYISGIVRLGDYTVKLRIHGKATDSIYDFFDMVIVPLHYYGDPLLYDYEAHKFGFVRGNYQVPEKALKEPLGAGPYVFSGYDGVTVYLKRNENYYKETSDIEFLSIRAYGEDVQEQVGGGDLDIVVLEGSRQTYESLCAVNENGSLVGDKLYVEEILDLGYSYIGIRADQVKVGDDPYSQESLNLRRGLLIAISAFRDSSFREYFGNSVHIIEYPISPFFGLTPEGDSRAFDTAPDGSLVYTYQDDEMSRFSACLEAVKGYLMAAGYTYNENTGKFTQAPDGASMRYEIMLSGSLQDEHPSFSALAYAKSVLYQLGISLDVRYVSSAENMLVYLYLGEADLWCASWNCIGSPNFDLHYASGSNTNLFGIKDEELDQWIKEFDSMMASDDQEAASAMAKQIMNRVNAWAVELPCYTLCDYLVYNVKTIDVSTLVGGHSLYWTWMDDVAFLDVYPQVTED